jgi:hypothetical protein
MEAASARLGRALQEVERVPEPRCSDHTRLPLSRRSLSMGKSNLSEQSALLHQVRISLFGTKSKCQLEFYCIYQVTSRSFQMSFATLDITRNKHLTSKRTRSTKPYFGNHYVL